MLVCMRFFPLTFFALLVAMLFSCSWAGVSRLAILANTLLTALMVVESGEFIYWLGLYEISVLAILSGFYVEGRAYRRFFALLTLLIFSAMSAAVFIFYAAEVGDACRVLPSASLAIFVLAILVKTPVFPFSFWLTEAHVEGSHLASVNLAAYAMKFSTAAVATLIFFAIRNLDFLVLFPLLGWLSGGIGVASSADVKKVSAALSVFHLAWGLLLFAKVSSKSEAQNSLVWAHHSAIAASNFLYIGIFYALSATRTSKNFFTRSSAPFSAIIFLGIALAILDFPISVSFLVELTVFFQPGSRTSCP